MGRRPGMTRTEVIDDPLAVTSAGAVLVNVTHLCQHDELHQLLDFAQSTGRKVFVGVELGPYEAKKARAKLDDMSAKIVATVYRER